MASSTWKPASGAHEPPKYSSRSGPFNIPEKLPENYRDVTEEEQEEYLLRVRPYRDFPVHPDDPYPVAFETDLSMDDIVWYRHTDRTWHLTRVLRFLPSHEAPRNFHVMPEGQKVWLGLTRGLDLRDPYRKHEVHLIPESGNTKPDNWYTRLLLRSWDLIPLDDKELEKMVQHFRQTINAA